MFRTFAACGLSLLEKKLTEASTSTSAHYVGSQTCHKCHQDIYDRWKKTPMANVVRDPANTQTQSSRNSARIPSQGLQRTRSAFVYGSKWKQRYFTKVGDDYYPLPAQWDIGNKDMAALSRTRHWSRLVDCVLSIRQHAATDRRDLRWLPLG